MKIETELQEGMVARFNRSKSSVSFGTRAAFTPEQSVLFERRTSTYQWDVPSALACVSDTESEYAQSLVARTLLAGQKPCPVVTSYQNWYVIGNR